MLLSCYFRIHFCVNIGGAGLKRYGKSCRLRWMNYLSPSVKHGEFTEQEEDLIIRLHNLLGNRFLLFFFFSFLVVLEACEFIICVQTSEWGIVLIRTVGGL